jgi:nicotinamidase-related amidase
MIDTAAFFREAKTAFVIIDLQRGIAGRDVAPHSGSQVVANAARLVEAFRRAQLPIAFVRVSPTPETALKPLVDNPQPFPPPQPGWDELVPELGVRQGDIVVTKQNWGAFYGTDLDLQLRRREVTRIAICGIATHIGVESTARDAFERNYKLLFVEDAMAAMTAQEHEHACTVIFPRMGIIRSTDQVVQALSGMQGL